MTADPAETPTIVTVADGLFVRQAVDSMGWIDLGEYAVVVDALEQPELEEEVFGAIASTIGDRPIRYVLNTHTHYDHVALNGAFQRRCGAEIVNQRAAPTGSDGRWFEGPKRRALMLPMPGCHTDEDCIVWVPEDRTLFVGDIFGWGLIEVSRLPTDDSAKLLIDTHQRLIDMEPATVVPGHGPVCTAAELGRWIEYFQWLRSEVARACEAGRSDGEIRAELAPPRDMLGWWRFVQWKHEDSLTKVLRAVRNGSLSA